MDLMFYVAFSCNGPHPYRIITIAVMGWSREDLMTMPTVQETNFTYSSPFKSIYQCITITSIVYQEHNDLFLVIIPQPPPLPNPPPPDLLSFSNPPRSPIPMNTPNMLSQQFNLPRRNTFHLLRILLPMNKPILKIIRPGDDEPVRRCSRTHAQNLTTRVDHIEVPRLAAVVGGFVGADEGLAFVLVEEVRSDVGVLGVEGFGLDEKVEDCGEDGDGGCVCGDLHAWEERVVEDEGDLEVADVWVLVGSGDGGVFLEGLAAFCLLVFDVFRCDCHLLVSHEDYQGFVGDSGIIEELHDFA